MRAFLLAFVTFFSFNTFALVDMRNGNYSENFTDVQISTSGFELKVLRAYNSRTLYNGLFGFGWCSELGTILKVNPDDTFRVTECGAGAEAEYRRRDGDDNARNKLVAQIIAEVRKRNKGRDAAYFKNLEFEIKRDSSLRDEFAKQLNLKGQVQAGVKYFADGRMNDTIELKGTEYHRTLPGGTFQKFDKEGRLVQMSDRTGNFVKLTYQAGKLSRITDNKGASLTLQYVPNSKYVKTVIGPSGLKAEYKYKGELLVEVKNAWGNVFKYEYDELYNMVKISYPDKSHVALTYNKEKDWVTSFRDRKGCVESYVYADGESDPLNNYKSDVTKKCDGKITNKSTFEFWHRVRADGTRYLSKTRSVRNGETSETEYHPVFGRPILVTQAGISTRFDYFDNGMMKLRADAGRTFAYKYDDFCNKVSEVTVTFARAAAPVAQKDKDANRKPSKVETKMIKTTFTYDKRTCYPTVARNTEGQVATLSYDFQGRVNRILDQSKKEVRITYDDRFGKASTIERPGLGKIRFKYKANGEVDKVETDESPLVAVQIADVFKQFLEMIAPATTDTTI
jgi:YD repeat-containing protein